MTQFYRKTSILLFILVTMVSFGHRVDAQTLPLFHQRYVHNFFYNPATSGLTNPVLTFIHRQNFTGVSNFGRTNLLSYEMPIFQRRAGFGVNVMSDRPGVVQNILASGSFAYHIRWNEQTSLSLGVAGEYTNIRADNIITESVLTGSGLDDPVFINNLPNSTLDFSAGFHLQTPYFFAGANANRVSTGFISDDSTKTLTDAWSAYLHGTFRVRNGQDQLEPAITYRKLGQFSDLIQAGVYYTYNNRLTIGGAYGFGDANMISGFASFMFGNVEVGYNYDNMGGNFGRTVGSANEFFLKIHFRSNSNLSYVPTSRATGRYNITSQTKTLRQPASFRNFKSERPSWPRKKVKPRSNSKKVKFRKKKNRAKKKKRLGKRRKMSNSKLRRRW